MKHSSIKLRSVAGFTLVEMAIVLAIMTFLLGGLLPMISSQIEQQRRTETRKYMEDVNNALLGYAIANKHLPCPDITNDGTADACATPAVGTLPYKDLGVPAKDAYGNPLIYGVTNAFAAPFTLSTLGTIRICTDTACATPLTSSAAAVIVSRGANGSTTFSPDELANIDNNSDFVSHDISQNSFDDLVIWISPNVLFNRMVAAGRLP